MTNGTLLESLFGLTGSAVLVTGGSTGIGKMMCEALLGVGAEVWVVARGKARADETASILSPEGRCHVIAADISTRDGIAAVQRNFSGTGRRLDILINNAGITAQAELGEVGDEHWDGVMDLNLKAPFMLIQALLPLMQRNRDSPPGQIINVGSCAGISITSETSHAYFASKAALHHLTRILAKQLIMQNIHVNAIAPGYFHTDLIDSFADDPERLAKIVDLIPAGRFGEGDDIAGLILMLATNRFMSGNIIPIDGGYLLIHS